LSDLAALAGRELFHLGKTVHDLFEHKHLQIYHDFDIRTGFDGIPKLGLSEVTNTELEPVAKALARLAGKPRSITSELFNAADLLSQNTNSVFRILGTSFCQLKPADFDLLVFYGD
jgi:hypothetical protein